MKVYIKNMVCKGTKFIVLHELKRIGLKYRNFELGEIDFDGNPSEEKVRKLDESLRKYGLELTFGKNELIADIQHIVLDLIEKDTQFQTSFSYYISQRAGYNYTYLNKYFRRETGLPIEEYYLEKKYENSGVLSASPA